MGMEVASRQAHRPDSMTTPSLRLKPRSVGFSHKGTKAQRSRRQCQGLDPEKGLRALGLARWTNPSFVPLCLREKTEISPPD